MRPKHKQGFILTKFTDYMLLVCLALALKAAEKKLHTLGQ